MLASDKDVFTPIKKMTYKEFLQTKIEVAPESGFEIDKSRINKALKPHQRDAVVWAIRGGRRALFESFGLGKTIQEIELNPDYFRDGVGYLQAAEQEVETPTLFDFMEV